MPKLELGNEEKRRLAIKRPWGQDSEVIVLGQLSKGASREPTQTGHLTIKDYRQETRKQRVRKVRMTHP